MRSALTVLIRLLLRVAPLVYMAFIWYLSSYPSDKVIDLCWWCSDLVDAAGQSAETRRQVVDTCLRLDGLLKESAHLVIFGVLYVLMVGALATFGLAVRWQETLAVAVAVGFGVLDEVHQLYVPARSATLVDLVKDVLGVAAAWYLVRCLRRRFSEGGLTPF